MKKTVAFLLSVIIAFSFASCRAEICCYNCGKGMSKSDSFCASCGMPAKDTDDNSVTEPESTTETTTVHTHSYNKKVTEPTCTEKGYTTYTCECGDSYEDDYVNAKHTYSKYVCTNCGSVDKKHAYEYLIEWVKENGGQRRNEIFVSIIGGDGAHEIVYNETYDYLYIRIEKSDSLLLLDLSDPNKQFQYKFEQEYRYEDYSVNGKVNAKTFTKGTVLNCDEYSGYYGDKDSILKLVALHIEIAITLLDMLNTLYDVDITYQDLGFESYVKK